jgi:tRNA (guanine37-N1)-methyltransferase
MLLVDAIVRLQPSVLGHELSAAEDSFSVTDESGRPLLDCPHYTRPRAWRDRAVPEVLLGGDHAAIEQWRLQQRVDRTRLKRPDLEQRDP